MPRYAAIGVVETAQGLLAFAAVVCAALALVSCGVPAEPEESAAPAEPAATDDADDADDVGGAERALEQLSSAYDNLAALVDRNSDSAVEWAAEDIENLGDWEYRIVDFSPLPPEDLEAELNALGDERWEVFWVESTASGQRMYLKRSSTSYLSKLPLSTLTRMLNGGAE